MSIPIVLALLALACLVTLGFATLTYSLREVSRIRLAEAMEKRGKSAWIQRTITRLNELVLATAIGRLFGNTAILLGVLYLFEREDVRALVRYGLAVIIAGSLSMLFSLAIPHALARYSGDAIVAASVRFLHVFRTLMLFITVPMHGIDDVIRRAVGAPADVEPEHVEQEILSAVEEGAAEGVVDDQERRMIESVIRFRDTTAGQIMTARPEMVALDLSAKLEEVKDLIEKSGHSRIPIFDGTLDHVVGALYARDLVGYDGMPAEQFDLRSALRPPLYIPETKVLRDLLDDFRAKKIHIAIVLDEYGGTAGLVTIEDVLEELVGDISDEHEPLEPAMFRRLSETVAEADARIYLDNLNSRMLLNLPEDAGYDTLGGFISTSMGHIPEKDEHFESHGVRFTVLDAEPNKVNRVKIEVIPQPTETPETKQPPPAAEVATPQGK
jgi:putative hemolysin